MIEEQPLAINHPGKASLMRHLPNYQQSEHGARLRTLYTAVTIEFYS